jgi:hypothetical protein
VEFHGPDDRLGRLDEEGMAQVLPRLRRVHDGNECRSCWYAYRAEVEGSTRWRLPAALPDLVRA